MPMLPDMSAWLMEPTTEGVAADVASFVDKLVMRDVFRLALVEVEVLRLVTFEFAKDAAAMARLAMPLAA